MGNIVAVCISEKKGTAKQNVGTCRFIENWGLERMPMRAAGTDRSVCYLMMK